MSFLQYSLYLITLYTFTGVTVVIVMHHLAHDKLLAVLEFQFVIAYKSCIEL